MKKNKKITYRTQETLIATHLKLVYSIAHKFQNRGLEFEDLVQEGNIGLMKAAEKYDHKLGYEFTTYATWWIRQAILKAIYNTGRNIRLPVHLRSSIVKLMKAMRAFAQSPTAPTVEQLAKESGLTQEVIRDLQSYMPDTISLDIPVGLDQETTLGDMVKSEIETADELLSQNSLREAVREVIQSSRQLKPKEIEVLKLRFGFDTDEELTLEQIGQMKGVTRERIRQMEEKALDILSKSPKMRKLKAIA